MNLSKAITSYRQQNKLSIRKAAKEMGINHQALWRLERGKNLRAPAWGKVMQWLFKS